MKKAQIEIMGLLIIVIMISLLMIFALRGWLSPSDDPSEKIRMRELARSFVGAMLNSNSGCTDDTLFSKVLIDCARKPETGTNDFTCENNMKSCDFAAQAIDGMLEDTIDVWKYPYEFKVIAPGNVNVGKLNFFSDNINEGERDSVIVFIQPLPIDTSGFNTMQIYLCIGGRCPNLN